MRLLDFEGVGFGYSEQAPILSEVNLSLRKGKRSLILGSNGSGKSTIALLAAGLLTPGRGKILSDYPGLRKGIVFQNSRLQMVGSTVEEDLAFGLTVLNLPVSVIRAKVNHFLELFGLEAKRQYGADQLSGGELRRLALAGVLITEPDLLILDEPLAMLDYHNQQIFLQCLDEVVPRETTILWLDHDLRSLRYTDDWFILSHEKTIEPVTLDQLNTVDILEKYGLQPTPLQPLEWNYPKYISHAILGPERVEFTDVKC